MGEGGCKPDEGEVLVYLLPYHLLGRYAQPTNLQIVLGENPKPTITLKFFEH